MKHLKGGQWLLYKEYSVWIGEVDLKGDKSVITFHDGYYTKYTNGVLKDSSEWKIEREQTGDYLRWMLHNNRYTEGYIYLCRDELSIHSSYKDGPDYYYVRLY